MLGTEAFIEKPYILGIDPGFNGAVAAISVGAPRTVTLHDMPVSTSLTGKKNIDTKALAALLEMYAGTTALAVLERVGAAPGQGVSSMFRFGQGFGQIQGILAAFKIRTLEPMPSVWKPSMGLSDDKRASLELAKATFPDWAKCFSRQKDDGRAEAALLAWFGLRSIRGNVKLNDLF